jgi:hypothetical protein
MFVKKIVEIVVHKRANRRNDRNHIEKSVPIGRETIPRKDQRSIEDVVGDLHKVVEFSNVYHSSLHVFFSLSTRCTQNNLSPSKI